MGMMLLQRMVIMPGNQAKAVALAVGACWVAWVMCRLFGMGHD